MSTFLELAKKVRQESTGVSGVGPASVVGQIGQLKKIVDWTADAWKDIQIRSPYWQWMRRPFTFNTTLDVDTYAFGAVTDVDAGGVITRFSRWWADDCRDRPRAYLQSSGIATQFRLTYLPFESFKWIYRFGNQTLNNGQPTHISVDRQQNLVIGPKPNGVYVITGDFQRGVQVLAADGDIPEMPVNYHDLIVYRAMEKAGANSVAAEVFARAQLEGNRLMRALEMGQLPEITTAGPLA